MTPAATTVVRIFAADNVETQHHKFTLTSTSCDFSDVRYISTVWMQFHSNKSCGVLHTLSLTEQAPWYRGSAWSYMRGGLSTQDHDYGIFNNIQHDIGTHVVHHLFPQVPASLREAACDMCARCGTLCQSCTSTNYPPRRGEFLNGWLFLVCRDF